MIDPVKLNFITGGQKRRKLALCLGALERDMVSGGSCVCSGLPRAEYLRKIIAVILEDPALPPDAAAEIRGLCESVPFDERRACNTARNHLLALIGARPAEWDLIIAPHPPAGEGGRKFFPGVFVYAEDIRSPFNLGSIFRTAEALGAEKLFLSPLCCPADHPRAKRAAMGCVETLPYERLPLEALPQDLPVFALETGGEPLGDFAFPQRGALIVGNEELGVSPQALGRATSGPVTIPLRGAKGSLNVSVALGIALNAWVSRKNVGLGRRSLPKS
ncbi:MAG: TrmH family RNA methyltransferase [Spirochaetaceae bacterium]|jgi:TrmH family RNA methyltransferase|nr:TrmH family RNA methyltransferase [Spirochaetaceae bacterium]